MRHSTPITTQEICTHILATFNSTHGKPVRLENGRPPHDTVVVASRKVNQSFAISSEKQRCLADVITTH